MLEITSGDRLYMTIVGRRDRKFLYDNQGAVLLNIHNKALNFGGEYQVGRLRAPLTICFVLTKQRQVFEGDTDKTSLLTVKNKFSLGGPRMVATFANFDDEPVELQVRGKLLNSKGKVTLNNEPIARFEGGIPEAIADESKKMGTASKLTVAPLGASLLLVRSIIFLLSCPTSRRCHDCGHLGMPARHFQQGLKLEGVTVQEHGIVFPIKI